MRPRDLDQLDAVLMVDPGRATLSGEPAEDVVAVSHRHSFAHGGASARDCDSSRSNPSSRSAGAVNASSSGSAWAAVTFLLPFAQVFGVGHVAAGAPPVRLGALQLRRVESARLRVRRVACSDC